MKWYVLVRKAGGRQLFSAKFMFLLFASGMIVLAVGLHALTTLPFAYSWARTLELFGEALVDAHFVVLSLIALLSGWYSRTGESISDELLRQFFGPTSLLASGMAVLGLLLPIILDVFSSYTLIDRMLFPFALFLLGRMLEERHALSAGASLMAGIGGLVVVSYVFTIVKSQLFVVRLPMDSAIVAAESWLFGEPLYATIAEWAKTAPFAIHMSDWVYYMFFHHIALVGLFLFAYADRLEEARYFVSLCACYLIGALSYYLFPTMGPVYFDRDRFSYLQEWVVFTPMIQAYLHQATEGARAGTLEMIDTYAFIAGMPSLHMAHESVMLYFSRRSPAMFALSLLFFLVSFVAVLVLGWHYFFEAVAGVVLAFFMVLLGKRVVKSSPSIVLLRNDPQRS